MSGWMKTAVPSDLPAGQMGLFLDVDGTLLDIAPRPDEVEVSPMLIDDLAAAEKILGGALALVSGRPIAELDRLFAPLRLCASGVHGAELRRSPQGPVDCLADGHLTEDDWRGAPRPLSWFPGRLS